MKPKLLMVEDSRFFGTVLKQKVETKLGHSVTWAKTYAEAERFLEDEQDGFYLGLLDLNLPDAGMGQIVDLINTHQIPAIVFTADLSDDVREHIWSKNIADYVLKQGQQDFEYLLSVINRIYRNATVKVLLVDDSRFSREHMANLLTIHRYRILQAENGEQALETLKDHPDVLLVITDYNMPGMNGDALTRKIRECHSREDLAIIGISAQGSPLLSAKFIKSGANDFIVKPFISEEFYCRVTQNVEMLARIKTIREMSNRDYLTGLYNRRHFFEIGNKVFANALRGNFPVAVGMIDIDNFKSINDQYGHDMGDAVLCKVSEILKNSFRESDFVARFGGEEFCVMITNAQPKDAVVPFEKTRSRIACAKLDLGGDTLQVTVSIGVCSHIGKSVEEMITRADQLLYEAKQTGKNRVVTD